MIAGAGVFQLKDLAPAASLEMSAGAMAGGFVAAMVSGYLCIRFLLAYLKTHPLSVFAGYVLVAGVLTIGLSLVRGA